ncbi:MAG: hypothetical protein RLZZ598_1703 [Pseudomonadota bacterium]|jgi:hypothetical protein
MNKRRSLLITVCGLLTAQRVRASDKLPLEFVGMWASEESRISGDQLRSGSAIYLTASGRGAIVGGAPRIAFRIEAKFIASTSRLEYVAFNGDKPGPSGGMDYDPGKRVLYSKDDPAVVLRRRATTVPGDIRKNLGL